MEGGTRGNDQSGVLKGRCKDTWCEKAGKKGRAENVEEPTGGGVKIIAFKVGKNEGKGFPAGPSCTRSGNQDEGRKRILARHITTRISKIGANNTL